MEHLDRPFTPNPTHTHPRIMILRIWKEYFFFHFTGKQYKLWKEKGLGLNFFNRVGTPPPPEKIPGSAPENNAILVQFHFILSNKCIHSHYVDKQEVHEQ